MRCRQCGADARVLETRSRSEGFVVARRRECAHGHSFWTYEVDDRLEKSLLKMAMSAARVGGFMANQARFHRDKKIRQRRVQGVSMSRICEEFGVSPGTVYRVAKMRQNGG